jgi:hypothetical protein
VELYWKQFSSLTNNWLVVDYLYISLYWISFSAKKKKLNKI